MIDVRINKLNETFLQLEISNDIANEIHEHFSCYVPGYKYFPIFKARLWNGKSSFLNFNNFTLPIGFLKNLKEFCKSFNYEFELTFDESSLSNKITDEEITEFLKVLFPPDSKWKLRDYQEIAVRQMIKNKRCLIELATGSGKSLVIYCIVKYFQMIGMKGKFILIVPSISLVEQMRTDFISYGYNNFDEDFGTIYHDSDNRDFSKQYLISTWQTLHKLPQSFMDKVDAFMVDEVHGTTFKSKVLVNVLSRMINCSWRMGCTGTLPTEAINIGSLIGYIGKIVSTVKSLELIEKKVLATINIVNVLCKYPETMIDKSGEYQDEFEKIIAYRDRNKVFKYIIEKCGPSKNVLLLVQRIEHLRSIKTYLQNEFTARQVYEIYGKVKGDERERIRKIVNTGIGSIICATYATMSTGVNIPNLNIIIFGSSAKSSQRIIQSIGRGLRKTEIKSTMTLFDVVDDLCWQKRTGVIGTNYLYDHWLERLKIYRHEGFPFKNISLRISEL